MPKLPLFAAVLACLAFGLMGALSYQDRSTITTTEDGRSSSIRAVDMTAKTAPRGSVDVIESVTVKYDGRFNGFYREIPVDFERGQDISVVSVGDSEGKYKGGADSGLGSTGAPGMFGATFAEPDLYRVVWHHRTENDSRTFVVRYRLSNATERFPEGDVIRSRVWGGEWKESVGELSALITLPSEKKAKISASPAWLSPTVSQQGNQVRLEMKGVPAHQPVDLLIELPRGELGPGVPAGQGGYPSLKASPADRAYTSFTATSSGRFLVWAGGLLVLGFGIAFAWMLFWKRRLRDADFTSMGVTYQPPAGQSLVAGYAAAQEENPGENRAVVATLVDLVARGFYQRDNVRGPDGEWLLEIGLPDSRPDGAQLTAGEKAVLDYFDRLLKDGPCLVNDLDSRVNPTPEDRERYNKMASRLMSDAYEPRMRQKDRELRVKWPAFLWVLLAGFMVACLTVPFAAIPLWAGIAGPLLVVCLIAVSVFAWPRTDFIHSDAEAMRSAGPWRSWRGFILSFSSMESAPGLQVILWERAFAGALLFGVAEEFTAQVKVLVPQLPDSSSSLSSVVLFNSALASSLYSSSSPPSSSSSGGGGGGFGGGGFGGGGGGSW